MTLFKHHSYKFNHNTVGFFFTVTNFFMTELLSNNVPHHSAVLISHYQRCQGPSHPPPYLPIGQTILTLSHCGFQYCYSRGIILINLSTSSTKFLSRVITLEYHCQSGRFFPLTVFPSYLRRAPNHGIHHWHSPVLFLNIYAILLFLYHR